jgi:hypothetical protein
MIHGEQVLFDAASNYSGTQAESAFFSCLRKVNATKRVLLDAVMATIW